MKDVLVVSVLVCFGLPIICLAAFSNVLFQARIATVEEYREVMDAATLHRKSGDMWLATIITDFLKADGELSYEDIQYLRKKREEIERKYITEFFLDGTYPYNTGGIGRNLNGRPNPIGQTGSKDTTASPPSN